MTATRHPIAVLLEDIRSLYNVGSVFRTSDAAGIEKIFLCGYTGYPPRREIEKTALGSVENVPWERIPNQFEAVNHIRRQGYQIIALEHTTSSISYTEARYRFPLFLVIGNEVKGVSEPLISRCDFAVHIPMYGVKHSLNVSVAFGIAAYHVVHVYLNDR